MDYEKAYKDALKRAKYWANNPTVWSSDDICQKLFPEIVEKKDERIKSCIEMCLTDVDNQRFEDYNTSLKDCLAWLEKQGPKKHEEELEKAYKCADKAQYMKGYEDAKCEIEKQGEQNPAWNKEDEGELYLTISLLDKLKEEAYTNDCENCINWLKSLKPQPQWKPTIEL